MTERKVQLHRGLREVYIDRTKSSFIDGDVGKLLYRGYDIHELAQNSTFEETAYLVINGHLPTQAQLDAFDANLKSSRSLPAEILDIIRLTRNSHPMDVLRTAVSALSAYDPDTEDNSTRGHPAQGYSTHRSGAHNRRGPRPHQGWQRGPRSRSRTQPRRQFPLYAVWRKPLGCGCRANRQGLRPSRRARHKRFRLWRACRGLYPGRPPLRHNDRHLGPEGSLARRSRRRGHEDDPGNRRRGKRRDLCP